MSDLAKNDKPRFSFGPGLIVAAAFFGPGTVLTASKAGAQFGYSLLWAVGFSVIAVIVLQEMASRLGIITGGGLSLAISKSFENVLVRKAMLGLVLVAILFGNAAYQTGNLLGASMGLEVFTSFARTVWIAVLAAVALGVIWVGRFDVLQYLLMALVFVMSVLFVVAAVSCGPDIGKLFQGFVPSRPATPGAEWIIVGLIGTTVVPYNLFLHASASATKWQSSPETTDETKAGYVRASLVDTIAAVLVGGLITASILVTAAAAFADADAEFKTAKDIAIQLRPAVGAWAETLFAIGLFAAGLTSAITAPIAAAYAASGCFGWRSELSNPKLKWVATTVVLVGAVLAMMVGKSPAEAVIAAQVANGLLLPIVAVFLLVSVNRKAIMSRFKNGWFGNLLGMLVILVAVAIAARNLINVWGSISKLVFGE